MYFRFIKDNKIVGYGEISIGELPFPGTDIIKDSYNKIGIISNIPNISCDTIERGIKFNDEIWYEGDKFRGPNGKATLKYFDYMYVWGMLHDGKEIPYTLAWIHSVGWEYKRIGNIHEQ